MTERSGGLIRLRPPIPGGFNMAIAWIGRLPCVEGFATSPRILPYFSPDVEKLLQGSIRVRATPNQGSQPSGPPGPTI